jgi:hypothetical protein
MTSPTVTEQQILEALRLLPPARWPEVLTYISSLQGQERAVGSPGTPILTTRDLAQSPLVGIWADRTDIGDSREFARRLREQAEHRGKGDASGH